VQISTAQWSCASAVWNGLTPALRNNSLWLNPWRIWDFEGASRDAEGIEGEEGAKGGGV